MPPSSPTIPSTLLHRISTHTAPINALTFSSSGGTFILTGSSDRQIHLSRTLPPNEGNTHPKTSPTTTTQPIQRYTSHGYPILALTVTQTNTLFASSSADRSGPFLWDINTPDTTLRRFGGASPSPHSARITAVCFTGADDSLLASGSDDRSVRLWDCKSRDARPTMVLDDAKDGVSCLVCVDTEIVVGSLDGRVRVYDVRMGRCVTDVQPGAVTSVSLGRDGRTLLVGCLDGRIRLMDRENGSCLRTFPPLMEGTEGGAALDGLGLGRGYVNSSLRLQSTLALGDSLVLSGSEGDGQVRAWDVLSGKQVGSVEVADGGKVVSVVKWREGSDVLGQERRGVWAAGGVDGIVSIYG